MTFHEQIESDELTAWHGESLSFSVSSVFCVLFYTTTRVEIHTGEIVNPLIKIFEFSRVKKKSAILLPSQNCDFANVAIKGVPIWKVEQKKKTSGTESYRSLSTISLCQ